jgi:hypothetical protein
MNETTTEGDQMRPTYTYRPGALVRLPADGDPCYPNGRVGMVTYCYATLYGSECVDVVYADADAGTDGQWLPLIVAETIDYAWTLPRSYMVAEIAPAMARKEI